MKIRLYLNIIWILKLRRPVSVWKSILFIYDGFALLLRGNYDAYINQRYSGTFMTN